VPELPDLPSVIAESHYAAVELQITDLTLAHTFMDRAGTSLDPATIERNRGRAREAYASVLHFLSTLHATLEQQVRIDARLPQLKARLDALQS
jgi:hypothetical protein